MIIHGRFPFSYPYHYSSLQIVRYSVVTYQKARNCGCRTQVRSPAKSTASKYSLPGGLQSKIMSSTCQKAKSCPQPAEKQKWYHNPQKTKSSISYREHKKESLQPRRVMTPDRGNPLKQGFSSLPLCTSCQQYYRLNVPGDVAMNVNGKAELIMIKFVIPNKSIN